MAKSKKNKQAAEKEPFIDITQRFPLPLYNRLVRYRKAFGSSSEQEVVRIIVNLHLKKEGY